MQNNEWSFTERLINKETKTWEGLSLDSFKKCMHDKNTQTFKSEELHTTLNRDQKPQHLFLQSDDPVLFCQNVCSCKITHSFLEK